MCRYPALSSWIAVGIWDKMENNRWSTGGFYLTERKICFSGRSQSTDYSTDAGAFGRSLPNGISGGAAYVSHVEMVCQLSQRCQGAQATPSYCSLLGLERWSIVIDVTVFIDTHHCWIRDLLGESGKRHMVSPQGGDTSSSLSFKQWSCFFNTSLPLYGAGMWW